MSKKTRMGFSMVEILIAMLFLSVVILSYLVINQQANRGAMDSYYELLAFSLAREPIEVFRSFGFRDLKMMSDLGASPIPIYPVNNWASIQGTGVMQHPAEAEHFQRRISLSNVSSSGINAVKVKVEIRTAGQSRVQAWLSRQTIILETLVVEEPR
jgi:Tfp pilus assembly protein PilV